VAFGSVAFIQRFADRHGWDTLAELGIGAIFIGVESKFAGEHGYHKCEETDAREVFHKLHSMGIRTLGAWICGWDFHDRLNVHEDLNYFVACCPTWPQITRLSPFPGTALYDKLMEEGRVKDVPWEDVHFWSGAQKNVAFELHETLNLVEYGYELMYRTWGPGILRYLDVCLNGYEYCLNSDNSIMREHKSACFKRLCANTWCTVYAMDRFAPNGVVRRRVRKIDERYRHLIGEPTPIMEFMARRVESQAKAFKEKDALDPFNRYPKEEPFKRYLYEKDGSSTQGAIPYTTEFPTRPPLKTWAAMKRNKVQSRIATQLAKWVRASNPGKGDPIIDDYLIESVRDRLQAGF
jgi:haloalkane dehalogenase